MLYTASRACGLLALVGFLATSAASSAAPLPQDISFRVTRDGEPMGSHSLSFRQDGDKLIVEIAIDLEVRIAFVPVFRYSHRNKETWQNGRLVQLETVTDDDGDKHKVSAIATDEGLRVTDSAGRTYLAPAGTIPTSYWNMATISQSALLNTQDGKLMPAKIEQQNDAAAHYRLMLMKDNETTRIDLWYDDQTWVRLAFEARGSKIEYELAGAGKGVRETGP